MSTRARTPRWAWITIGLLTLALVLMGVVLVTSDDGSAPSESDVWIAALSPRERRIFKSSCAMRATTVEVFLGVRATDDEIAGVRSVLESTPGVGAVRYLDKDAAYEEFQRIFRKDSQLIANVSRDVLPTSFRVEAPRNRAERISSAVETLPGVDDAVQPWRALTRTEQYCPD